MYADTEEEQSGDEDDDPEYSEEEEEDEKDDESEDLLAPQVPSPMPSPMTAIGFCDPDEWNQHVAPRRRGRRVRLTAPPEGGAAGGRDSARRGSFPSVTLDGGRRPFGSLRGTPMAGGSITSSVTIDSSMSSDEVFEHLRQIVSSTVLSGLSGHLLRFVAPSLCPSLMAPPPSFGASIKAPFSEAFVGPEKKRHSSGQQPSTTNNSVMAAISCMWVGPVTSEFPGKQRVCSERAPRRPCLGLAEHIILPALNDEIRAKLGAQTASDLIRGVRASLYTMDADGGENARRVEAFMHATFARAMKAHRAKNRRGLSMTDIFGGNSLRRDFANQVATLLAVHAIAELEHAPLTEVGAPETIACRAVRQVRSWSKLQTGGFGARNQRAFQEVCMSILFPYAIYSYIPILFTITLNGMWRHLYGFITSPRRLAHGLTAMDPASITNADARRYLTPYYTEEPAIANPEPASDGEETVDPNAGPLRVEETLTPDAADF
ncbi:unnamed protein product [Ectocarpus sp. CCAP 1310/34]|nr:unnamed protein product [Ectocarpus sp. CCAP 1310/34]